MIRCLPVLAVLLSAAPALAQESCPVAADLARGILVAYDDGSTERFRATDRSGVVAVRGSFADGSGYDLELGQGVHVLSTTPRGADGAPILAGQVAYDYGLPPEALPVPAPGERFDVASVATDASGQRPEAQSQAYGALEPLAIGGCAYEAVPVAIAYDSPLGYWEELSFLPALGIAVLRSQSEAGQETRRIAPVSIRAGK